MHRLLTHLTLLSALLALPTSALAFEPGGGSSPAFHVIAERLELTDEQVTQVTELLYQADSEAVDIRARIEKAELDLRHLLDAPELDDKAVRKAVEALNGAESDARFNRIELAIALRDVLSLEQWRDLERMRARKQHGGSHDGPPRPPAAPPPPAPPDAYRGGAGPRRR